MERIIEHVLTLPEEISTGSFEGKIAFMYSEQLTNWDMARNHYRHFESVERRVISAGDFNFIVQHNPARARSTCADLSAKTIETRKCFLCSHHLPQAQKGLIIKDKYLLLVNPFPIFDRHITISDFNHCPQRIDGRIIDMLEMAALLPQFTVFYNGPLCGASAPDHFHFQAAQKGIMPVDSEVSRIDSSRKRIFVGEKSDVQVYELIDYLRTAIVMESQWKEPIDYCFARLMENLPQNAEAGEPLMNLIASYTDGVYRLIVFPRKAQRPSCYYAVGDERIIVSPASVELGGIIVTPREEDFQRLTLDDLKKIFDEVSLKVSFKNFVW